MAQPTTEGARLKRSSCSLALHAAEREYRAEGNLRGRSRAVAPLPIVSREGGHHCLLFRAREAITALNSAENLDPHKAAQHEAGETQVNNDAEHVH